MRQKPEGSANIGWRSAPAFIVLLLPALRLRGFAAPDRERGYPPVSRQGRLAGKPPQRTPAGMSDIDAGLGADRARRSRSSHDPPHRPAPPACESPDRHTARQADPPRRSGNAARPAVVSDLYEVVDLGALANDGVTVAPRSMVELAPISTSFWIMTRRICGIFLVPLPAGEGAKAVLADPHARVNDHAITEQSVLIVTPALIAQWVPYDIRTGDHLLEPISRELISRAARLPPGDLSRTPASSRANGWSVVWLCAGCGLATSRMDAAPRKTAHAPPGQRTDRAAGYQAHQSGVAPSLAKRGATRHGTARVVASAPRYFVFSERPSVGLAVSSGAMLRMQRSRLAPAAASECVSLAISSNRQLVVRLEKKKVRHRLPVTITAAASAVFPPPKAKNCVRSYHFDFSDRQNQNAAGQTVNSRYHTRAGRHAH